MFVIASMIKENNVNIVLRDAGDILLETTLYDVCREKVLPCIQRFFKDWTALNAHFELFVASIRNE